MLENGKKYTFNTTDAELLRYNRTDVEIIRPLTETECDVEDIGNMYKVRFTDGYEKDVFEDELEEIKYYELCYFYGRKRTRNHINQRICDSNNQQHHQN